METTEKKLPKATPEIVKEYDELQQKLNGLDPSWSAEEANAALNRVYELENSYDWFHEEFTDPATGKKGLKTITGEIIAPALYDGFYEYHNYVFTPHAPVIAIKDGKCGIVKGDGSGQQLCEFKFDAICSVIFSSLFRAYWGGVEDCFGIITATGDIICPNILTRIDEPFNTLLPIGTDDKTGCIDLYTNQLVSPEYDDVDLTDDGPLVFIKDDQRGYVTDKGEFITLDQYENDENYIDVPVISTRLP